MNKKKVTYICPICKTKEDFDFSFVDMLDCDDKGDQTYPPRLNCENCEEIMVPIYYKNYNGIVYEYKEDKN